MEVPIRALILEDCEADVHLVVHELRRGGFKPSWECVQTEADFLTRLDPGLDVILSDYSMPDFDALRALRLLRKSGLNVPFLIVSGSIGEDIAVAAMKEGADDYFLKDRLGRLAEAVKYALERTRLRGEKLQAEELLRQRALLAQLSADVGVALNRNDTLAEMLRFCTEALVRNLQVSLARIWTLDAGQDVLELRASSGLDVDLHGLHSRIPVGKLTVGRIAQQRTPHVTDDVGNDPHFGGREWARREGLNAFAGYPLLVEGRLIGVMALLARQPLGPTTLEALVTVANQIALGIERKGTEQRLRHVLASSPAIIYSVKIRGEEFRLAWISDSLRVLMGYDVEEALAPGWWQEHLHPQDRTAELNRWLGFLREGRLFSEYRFRHKDGTYRWIRDEKQLLRNAAGEILECVGSWSDVTEFKQLEEQFRQAQKMEAVGRLAGGVAHDFNNLLTVIGGYSEMSLASMGPEDPQREGVTEVLKASERAASLTRQLLALGRRQVLQPVSLDLNALAVGMENMLHRLIGEDIELRVCPGEELWRVRADPGMIEQVVMNLVVNARDAMPRGGKITIETSNRKLSEIYAAAHVDSTPGEHVLLAVTDTGQGMDDATKARIFEPFFTTKEVGKGTGLGLSTVHGIVKQSGGRIEVYSEPEHGTTFKIYLPRDTESAPPRRSTSSQARAARGTETVLLVEDEAGVRALTRAILSLYGYTVLEADSGTAALRHAETHLGPIHLLLTDVVMPEMSGPQLAERLLNLRPLIRVLYCSGYPNDAVVHHGILAADTHLLQKPFGPEALSRKVREVLDE